MRPYEVLNFDDWNVQYIPVGGANEKDWFVKGESRGLFKYAKGGGIDGFICGEYWSERMASDVFRCLDIECMEVDMGMFKGRLGSMCYDLTLTHGKFIEYSGLQVKVAGTYEIEEVRQHLCDESFSIFISMLLIDYMIGNTDRHSGNFGVLENTDKIAPMYDNGSSLCCRERPEDAKHFLKDNMRMGKYTTKNMKSFVVLGGYRLKTDELLSYLKEAFPREVRESAWRLACFTNEELDALLHNYTAIVHVDLLEVIKRSVMFRRNLMLTTFEK